MGSTPMTFVGVVKTPNGHTVARFVKPKHRADAGVRTVPYQPCGHSYARGTNYGPCPRGCNGTDGKHRRMVRAQ